MKLRDLLNYHDILIQCHNDPDADALASGFAVYTYLREHGRQARLVYGGDEIHKRNLLLMTKRLGLDQQGNVGKRKRNGRDCDVRLCVAADSAARGVFAVCGGNGHSDFSG